VALSLIIPVVIGYWLDSPKMSNKQPLFTFIGLGVGTVIAFFGLIKMLLRYQAEQEKLRKNNNTEKKQGS
jgi:F0F1-type ATP synthase assembly protein I